MSIERIRAGLQSASAGNSGKIIRALSREYEDELLGVEAIPDDYLALFLDLVSDEALFVKKGVWEFVTTLYMDSSKLSESQKGAILNAFLASYSRYADERLCLTVADFIARVYSADVAYQAFVKLSNEADPEKMGELLVGIETILKNVGRKTSLWGNVKNLYEKAQRKIESAE